MIRITERQLAVLGGKAAATVRAAGRKPPPRPAAGDPAPGEAPPPRWSRRRLERREWEGAQVVITVNLAPRPKERARTFMDERVLARAFASAAGDIRRFMALVKGKSRGGEAEGGVMRTVTPEDTRQYENAVRLVSGRAMAVAGLEPFACPVEMEIEFRHLGDPGTWPTAEGDGDLDNLEKSILDGMNRVVYLDDRLVVRKTGIKACAADEGITVTVRPAAP